MQKGKTIYHWHGSQKGKKIKTYSSILKAKRVYWAMVINRKKK